MYASMLSGVTALLSLSIAIQAFTLPCYVGEQKCGFYLATVDGINYYPLFFTLNYYMD